MKTITLLFLNFINVKFVNYFIKFYKLNRIFYCKNNLGSMKKSWEIWGKQEQYKNHLLTSHPEMDTLNILV